MSRPGPAAAAPPPRRRITPVAVEPQAPGTAGDSFGGAEEPLRLPPAPATGSTKTISASGRGRRVWVDIQGSWQLKFKDVLRQQGLDHATWKQGLRERRTQLEGGGAGGAAQGAADAKRQAFAGVQGLYQRVQGLYQVSSDEGQESDQDGEDDSSGSEQGAGGSDAGAASDDDSSDGSEDASGAAEVDLDREEERDAERARGRAGGGAPGGGAAAGAGPGAAAGRPAGAGAGGAPRPQQRQRFERYDDDFIDDSELEMVRAPPRKTKFSGFYVSEGAVETLDEPPARPRPKPRPKPAAKQQQQQQQPPGAAPAVAGKRSRSADGGEDAGAGAAARAADAPPKKKRPRGDAAGAAVPQETDRPPAGKKAKPSPAAEAGAPHAAPGGPAAAAAPSAARPNTAAQAMAAAAAAAKAKQQAKAAAGAAAAGADGHPAGGAAPQAVPPPQQPSATPAQPQPPQHGAQQEPGSAAAATPTKAAPHQQPLLRQQSPGARPLVPTPPAATAVGEGDAAAAAGGPAAEWQAAATGGAVEKARSEGLPEPLLKAIAALQQAVLEHKPPLPPASKAAAMTKAVRTALEAAGVALARLPPADREAHGEALVRCLRPLMLPYMKLRKLRRVLLEDPGRALAAADAARGTLLAELAASGGGRGAAAGGGSDAEDFQPQWSASAEQALALAWAAAQPVPDQVEQLAVEVATHLGWSYAAEPSKAVAELRRLALTAQRHVNARAKAPGEQAGVQLHPPAAAIAAAAAAAMTAAAPPAPAPSEEAAAAAAAAAAAGAGAPNPTAMASARLAASAERPRCTSADGSHDGQPQSGSVSRQSPRAAAGTPQRDGGAPRPGPGSVSVSLSIPLASGGTPQKDKHPEVKFSSASGPPSPRLRRCLDAAAAAGAPREWLQDAYGKLRSQNMHMVFRVLCLAGPEGCQVNRMASAAAEGDLALPWEDSASMRQGLKTSLGAKAMGAVAGTTEANPKAWALLCFDGVNQQAPKPPKAAADAGGSGGGAPPAPQDAQAPAAEGG